MTNTESLPKVCQRTTQNRAQYCERTCAPPVAVQQQATQLRQRCSSSSSPRRAHNVTSPPRAGRITAAAEHRHPPQPRPARGRHAIKLGWERRVSRLDPACAGRRGWSLRDAAVSRRGRTSTYIPCIVDDTSVDFVDGYTLWKVLPVAFTFSGKHEPGRNPEMERVLFDDTRPEPHRPVRDARLLQPVVHIRPDFKTVLHEHGAGARRAGASGTALVRVGDGGIRAVDHPSGIVTPGRFGRTTIRPPSMDVLVYLWCCE
ncbi:hypothetical protein OH76DRAFT_1170850 [Lentinus brumalis]|uniref:Uncharacterized protein n=1 Tax=Lentinus brumalis TaxID=2498619 RepID=A0A371CU92_9APHY|nr:hypothetical protein OH76DRAFT_1170850 [Polyporus brumalis]